MPNSGVIPTPDLLFRVFGYGGLALVSGMLLLQGGPPGLWWVLGFACVWPGVWIGLARREPRLLLPGSALGRLAHAGECCLVTGITVLAGLGFWLSVAAGLLCLTGVTALGGVHLLAPSAALVGLVLLAAGRLAGSPGVPGGVTVAGILLASGFLLGLAWLSHARVRRLDAQRRRVVAETVRLKEQNARLARYLPDPPPVGEARRAPRERFVTVAFVDVVGFVALVAARPVGELAEVLGDFMARVEVLAARRGGTVGKFLGDGVLLYFPGEGSRDAGDHHRGRAAAACAGLCLELGPSLAELSRAWRRRGLTLNLGIRAGIASGYCAIGDWGGQRLDYTLIGMPVNLASRLQGEAEPGGILVSDATAALLAGDAALSAGLRRLGCREVRGVGPVVVHALESSAKVRAIPLPASQAGSP